MHKGHRMTQRGPVAAKSTIPMFTASLIEFPPHHHTAPVPAQPSSAPPDLAAVQTHLRGGSMLEQNEAWVQLATRIPRRLHREMKLHCVAHEQSLMAFVVEALREKLTVATGDSQSARRGRRAS